MGTLVECGSVSVLALFVPPHRPPWERQLREQPDVITHRQECTEPRPLSQLWGLFYQQENMLYIHSTWTCNVYINKEMLQGVPNDERWDQCSSVCPSWGAQYGRVNTWISFPPNKQRSGGESKQINSRASLNPCHVILLHCVQHRQSDGEMTEWWSWWRRGLWQIIVTVLKFDYSPPLNTQKN